MRSTAQRGPVPTCSGMKCSEQRRARAGPTGADRVALAELDGAVGRERPTWVVGHLPDITVGIGEGAGVAAPAGARSRSDDRRTGALSLSEQGVDLPRGADVMRQLDPGR